jgi:hypothetical protein
MTQPERELEPVHTHGRWTIGMSARERAVKLWLAGFLILHVLPLLAGSTNFTIFTFLHPPHAFSWSYIDLSYSNGWGYVYQSAYSPWQIAAYLLAYASGIVLHPKLTRPSWLATIAAGLCVLGGISFVIEASHFAFDHHLSLIASFPIVLLPIDLWTIWRVMRNG